MQVRLLLSSGKGFRLWIIPSWSIRRRLDLTISLRHPLVPPWVTFLLAAFRFTRNSRLGEAPPWLLPPSSPQDFFHSDFDVGSVCRAAKAPEMEDCAKSDLISSHPVNHAAKHITGASM
ncbi:unnamed protein product [Leuciscus chuanchicus]